ncbi:MAG: HEAT repeat domain-containing protein, partial [Candidatus Thorarchaeota archaeon]
MTEKDEQTESSESEGEESVGRFRKAKKRGKKKSDNIVEKMLSNITSIQACKDAALTGDDDLRLLAVCRLGEFGAAAFEALDISLNDDSQLVRTAAAGMLGYSEDQAAIEILKPYLADENETVRATIELSLSWLDERAVEKDHGTQIPENWEAPTEFLLDSDATPLKTSDNVAVVSTYTAAPESLEFGLAIGNNSLEPIREVSVKVLNYPKESLKPLDPLSQI